MEKTKRGTSKFFTLLSIFIFFTGLLSLPTNGSSEVVKGLKWPHSPDEEGEPIVDFAKSVDVNEIVNKGDFTGSFTELLPYVLSSPDQEDAGSCLYMSHTGIAEWWLQRLHPFASAGDGPYDLSERYLMNISAKNAQNYKDWQTDTIFLFNKQGIRNQDYRYTKGYYKVLPNGTYVKGKVGERYVKYGTGYNWVRDDFQMEKFPLVDLPEFKREIIFADPQKNQWNVGVTPQDIVAKVKMALEQRKAPINVIYNHLGYWHSVVLLGYQDNIRHHCSFVKSSFKSIKKIVEKYQEKVEESRNAEQKKKWLTLAEKHRKILSELIKATKAKGCRNQGVFFVRDSIYSDPKEPLYDYDIKKRGEERHYSSRVIQREYEWLEILANHIVQIYVEE